MALPHSTLAFFSDLEDEKFLTDKTVSSVEVMLPLSGDISRSNWRFGGRQKVTEITCLMNILKGRGITNTLLQNG
jgi:hypothetical protein